MEFQVRKGLETPLKVHGMNTRFFLVYCIILAVLVLFIVGFLTNAMSGEGSFVMFIVALMVGALVSVFLRVLFINLSIERKFKKLFKFYSKIILWQRYASWLRACQPCIHSQWSVS